MNRVTRARPKVDRVACPWLLRRFVDPGAEFPFVPGDKVMEVAAREGARSEVALWGHERRATQPTGFEAGRMPQ